MLKLKGLTYDSVVFSVLFVLAPMIADDIFPEICLATKDRGHRCKNNTEPKLKYYFDSETEQCLPFLYKGCGGNENRFPSAATCRVNCIPQDYARCALRAKEYDDENKTVICFGPESTPCPKDYVCTNLAFFGICCPKETEELFERNVNPQCKKGNLVKYAEDGFRMALLGKTCDDEFCPENSKCVQQEVFAHCCL